MRSDAGSPTARGPDLNRRLPEWSAGVVAVALLGRVVFAARSALDGGAADYVAFATGARVLASGSRCLYCLAEQTTAQVAVLGYRPPPPAPGFPAPYANPPLVAWMLQPLALRPLSTALPLFVAASVVALVLAALLLFRLVAAGRSGRTGAALLVVAVATLSLPGATAILLGQWDPLILLCLAVSLTALAAERELLAGLAASGIFIKPQLGLLLALVVVLTARRRLIAGFGLGVAVWALTSLALVGPAGLVQWARYVDVRLGPQATYARGLAGLAAALGGDAHAVEVTGLLVGGALAVGAVVLRARLRADPGAALALGVAASLCCTPHVFSDDMLLVAPALAIGAVRRPRQAAVASLALNCGFLLDEYLLPARLQRVEGLVALVVVIGLTVALGSRPAGHPRRPHATPELGPSSRPAPTDPHNEPVRSRPRSQSLCPCAPSSSPSPAWP